MSSDSSDWFEHRPRLPGLSAPRAKGRRAFGASWWGQAWTEALEQRARLDPNRLPRGRTYARTGAVGPLTLAPGEVLADVQGSRTTPYRVRVRVRQFDASEWDRLLDALASEIGHAAALLDGELPAPVADDVRSVGLDLLPGPGELQPRCSCPDWADPCKHAAAVCYLVADALDADPFGVLLLRGRGREEVLAGLRSRRHFGMPDPPRVTSNELDAEVRIVAKEAWSRIPSELPTLPLPPRRVGPPAVLGADPPADAGIDAPALRALAADAAARAFDLLRGAGSSGLELSAEQDLARRAAQALATSDNRGAAIGIDELARRAGLPASELLRRALAFRDAGPEGLSLLDEAFEPDRQSILEGRALLGPGARAWRNRVTLGERQIRLGHDGHWYPFRKDRAGRWCPDGPALNAAPVDDEIGRLDEEATAEEGAPLH